VNINVFKSVRNSDSKALSGNMRVSWGLGEEERIIVMLLTLVAKIPFISKKPGDMIQFFSGPLRYRPFLCISSWLLEK